MPDVGYTIYRKTVARETTTTASDEAITVLVRMGVATGTGPRPALQNWFASLPYSEQVAMNGAAKFVVIPTSNHHDLAPKVESVPRLVF